MTNKSLNQLAILTILNNLVFVVILQGSLTTEFIKNPKYVIIVEIVWILCLTGQILLPTIMYTLLKAYKTSVHKFSIIAICMSIISIAFFAFTGLK
ncbi:MAG: hypothetical protein ACRCVU_09575 [Flavobacterium sp.]